jgi:hypothetical protein
MSDWESSSRLREASSQSGAPPSPAWPSGRWWWQRHLHVPVVVWIVASVLGGAAIGSALEPDGTTDETPTTVEVVAEPVEALACDENYAACVPVASDVDCADTDTDVDADDDGPSYFAEPVGVVGNDVYNLDADHNGIGCD